MPSRPARLLCAGKDMGLLNTRCEVLTRSGYDAQWAYLAEAETILRSCHAALKSRNDGRLFSTDFQPLTTRHLHLKPGTLQLKAGQSSG